MNFTELDFGVTRLKSGVLNSTGSIPTAFNDY